MDSVALPLPLPRSAALTINHRYTHFDCQGVKK